MRKNILTLILFFFVIIIAGIVFWERQLMDKFQSIRPNSTIIDLTAAWGTPDSDFIDKNHSDNRILKYRTISGFTTYIFKFDAQNGRLIQKYADD